MMLFFYFKEKKRGDRAEKKSEILAQQIAQHRDLNLENGIFMAAINTDVEKDVYHLMVKAQTDAGRIQ